MVLSSERFIALVLPTGRCMSDGDVLSLRVCSLCTIVIRGSVRAVYKGAFCVVFLDE